MRFMNHTTRLLLTAAALTIFVPALAHADTFVWSFAGPDVSGSGTLTATPDGNPGEFLITSGSGTILDSFYSPTAVTLVPCATPAATCTFVNIDGGGANITFDDLLFPGNALGAQLDNNGVAFAPGPNGSGSLGINIYDGPSQEFYSYGPGGAENLSTPFNVVPAPTPEPSSLILLGSGALSTLTMLRKRKQ